MKEKLVHVRLSNSDYKWLTENIVNKSSFIRSLVQESRRKDEDRPLDERITETRKRLDEAKEFLESCLRNAWADTAELTGTINHQQRLVQVLEAKLARLSAKS